MKKQIIIATLASLFTSVHATELNLQLEWNDTDVMISSDATPTLKSRPSAGMSTNPMSKPRNDREQTIVTPAFQIAIHPEDATAGSNPAYDIKSSGRYYLANDFKIAVTTSGASLIGISSDNVTLNLNSKIVSPHVSATQTNLVGIINNDCDNLTILNGTIQCTPTSGSARITTGINLGSSASYTIKVHDIFVNQATANGISGSNLNDVALERVACNNGASTAASVNGATLSTCKNINIQGCEFNNNTTSVSTGASKGLSLSGCQDGVISNVVATSNTTTHTDAGGIAVGIGLVSTCQNLAISNCVASNNTSSSQDTTTTTMNSTGFDINASPLNRFTGCVANGNGGSSGSDNNAVGFHIIGASHSCSLVNCEASQNRAAQTSGTTPVANGFRINGNTAAIHNILVDGCVANYNQASGGTSSDAAGFYLRGLANSRVLNSEASKNTSGLQDAYGFYIVQADSSTGNENILISNCIAKANTASTATKNAIGFYTSAGTNNRFVKCKAKAQSAGAGSTSTEGSGGAGFHLAGETRSQVVECEAIGNATATHANAFAYGFYLSSADSCSVKDCYAAYNSAGGSGKHFGFYDASTSTNTLILSNTSAGHGKCLTSNELNASMQWKTTNGIPDYSLNFHFNHPGTGSNPQHVVHEVPKWNLVSLSTTVQLWENVSIY
jgi:hypothetical protein